MVHGFPFLKLQQNLAANEQLLVYRSGGIVIRVHKITQAVFVPLYTRGDIFIKTQMQMNNANSKVGLSKTSQPHRLNRKRMRLTDSELDFVNMLKQVQFVVTILGFDLKISNITI